MTGIYPAYPTPIWSSTGAPSTNMANGPAIPRPNPGLTAGYPPRVPSPSEQRMPGYPPSQRTTSPGNNVPPPFIQPGSNRPQVTDAFQNNQGPPSREALTGQHYRLPPAATHPSPYRPGAAPPGMPKGQAPASHPAGQAIPREIIQKRLPVKSLPKRPKISLTPDRIRWNPNRDAYERMAQETINIPWDFSNHIDPFNSH